MLPDLTVSIIIHGDYSHVYRALASLLSSKYILLKIYITININGADDEYKKLHNQFPKLNYIINENAQGFATNHNHILQISQTPYILLLNDDTELSENTLQDILLYLEQYTEIGIASPRILNPDNSPQLTAYSFPTLPRMIYKLSGLGYITRQGSTIRNFVIKSGLAQYLGSASLSQNDKTQIVPVVVGVAMFVRREAYQDVGGMDEDTIVYGEEFSWQWRLKQNGWNVAVIAEAHIKHFNIDKNLRGWKLVEHRKGMLNFFCRYRPLWQTLILRTSMAVLHGIRWLFNLIFDRENAAGDWLIIKLALTWQPNPNASGSKYIQSLS